MGVCRYTREQMVSASLRFAPGSLGARVAQFERRTGWLAIVAAVLLFATGCGHPAERAIQGRWLGESVENFDDDEMAAASGWAKGTSFEFSGSTLTVAIPAEEPRTGTYRIAATDERNVRLAVLSSDGEQEELELILDDERNLRWILGEGRALVMHRQ